MAGTQPLVNAKEISDKLAGLEKSLIDITPELNKAQTAFGGLEDLQKQHTTLLNAVRQAKAVYGQK